MPRVSRPWRYPFALGCVAAAAAVSNFLLVPTFGASTPFLAYFPAVTGAGCYGGLGPGLLATAVSAVCVRLFAMQPRLTLSISDPNDYWRLLVFLASGALVSYLNHRLHLQSQAQAREQERTSRSLQEFSHTVSHNLRAPLRALQGYSHLLAKRSAGSLDAEGRALLSRIERSAVLMDQLINDFLAFADIEEAPAAPSAVDLDRVVSALVDHYPELSKAEVTVERPLGAVRANEALLLQALAQIVVNAITYKAPGRRPVVRIAAERHGRRRRLWVEDNGVGIAPEVLPKVFGTFERGTLSEPGTGMGLAIARKAIERSGGRIGVESQPSRGSRFWVELPEASRVR